MFLYSILLCTLYILIITDMAIDGKL